MAKKIIAVMGATGTQGSGVVAELLARGQIYCACLKPAIPIVKRLSLLDNRVAKLSKGI